MGNIRHLKCATKANQAFTLIEMMLSTGLVVFLIATVFLLMSGAQNSFFVADASIDLRNQLREADKKIMAELRQTGFDSGGSAQFTLSDNVGINSTDILTFSIPVLCNSTMTNILNSNGDPAYWGAPLTWGCTTSSCMDADNNCATVEYKSVRYLMDSNNNLVRQVLSSVNQIVAQTTIAQNIIDFQINSSTSANGRIIAVVITGQKQSVNKRTVAITVTEKILVGNYGT